MIMQRVPRENNKKNKRRGKGRSPRPLEVLARQMQQILGPTQVNMVIGVEPEMQNQDHMSWILDASCRIMVTAISIGGLIKKNAEQALGMSLIV